MGCKGQTRRSMKNVQRSEVCSARAGSRKPNAESRKKMNLRTLLDYQEHSVVSRVLLKNAAGTITLFAFAEGEALSEHTAPFDAFITVLEGSAEVDVSGVTSRLGDGDGILLPANEPHAVRATSAFKMLLVMMKAQAQPK